MKIGIAVAIFVVCGLTLTSGAFGTPHSPSCLPGSLPILTGDQVVDDTLMGLEATGSGQLSSGWQNLLSGFEGAVIERTRRSVEYIRDANGVLQEIITNINGNTVSGEVTTEENKTIHQLRIEGSNVSMTVASAQIIVSSITDENGNSYRQVQMVSPCDADEDGLLDIGSDSKPRSQIVLGFVEKEDGTREYFGTIRTNIVYNGNDIISSDNADVSEINLEQLRQMATKAGYPDLLEYMLTL